MPSYGIFQYLIYSVIVKRYTTISLVCKHKAKIQFLFTEPSAVSSLQTDRALARHKKLFAINIA